MNNIHTIGMHGGFKSHTLSNENIRIIVIPALGGRIVSILDKKSRREWLDGWMPASKRRVWKPTDPANYETGPGAGLDECLPTVLPCRVGDSELPDHGELWNTEPRYTVDAKEGFTCHWSLRSLPLDFSRRVTLGDDEVRFDYELTNRADVATPFLWAWHPLFTLMRGDQICADETTCCSPGGEQRLDWPGNDLSRALFAKGATPAAKVFLGPMKRGEVAIRSAKGAYLQLFWDAKRLPYAGIWITRGFWKGLTHWAIEPTNAPVDRLSDVPQASEQTLVPPLSVISWSVRVRLGCDGLR